MYSGSRKTTVKSVWDGRCRALGMTDAENSDAAILGPHLASLWLKLDQSSASLAFQDGTSCNLATVSILFTHKTLQQM